jgi:hypothetical protein
MIELINDTVNSNALDSWKKELDIAVNRLKKLEANMLKAETTYANATQWEAKLRGWKDSLTQTAELTALLESELKAFSAQLSVVSTNTGSVVTAIDILYCEVKKVFYDTTLKDTSKCYPCDVETLAQMIRQLQNDVNCVGNVPNLNKSGGFLKKVTELEAKLKAVEDVREDILKKLITLVQSVNLMLTSIYNDPDGLQGIVHAMECEFSGGDTVDEGGKPFTTLSMPRHCGCHDSDEQGQSSHSCNSVLSPVIKFPLEGDKFLKEIEEKHTAALKEKGNATDNYKKARDERDRLLARKNGLSAAIAAAMAAKK